MKGIYFAVPVCGEAYVQRWLRYGLPSLLSPGNLPALAKVRPVKMLLCSTQEDLPRILASPAIKAARDVLAVRAIPMAKNMAEVAAAVVAHGNKFHLMNACHNYGVKLGRQDDYGLICGVGDGIYSDGTFAEVARQIENGKRAVVTQGLDLLEDSLDTLLAAHGAHRDEPSLTVPPRTLVKVACEGLHPVSRSMVWGAEPFTVHPSVLYWPLDGHGFVMRGWHLFPLFLYPDREAEITTTIDGDYLGEALSSLDDCTFVDDSDRCFFAGVSSLYKQDFIPATPHRADPAIVAQWMTTNTKPINRDIMIRQKFWLHDGIERSEWRHVEEASDLIVAACLDQYARLSAAK